MAASFQGLLLSSVELERFKAAFKPAPIPLGPLTVVVGRNGSGKSTLLEALQWIDTTMRQDARAASERYYGIHDLINLRSQAKLPYFRVSLNWNGTKPVASIRYSVTVTETEGDSTPQISEESLNVSCGDATEEVIRSEDGRRVVGVGSPAVVFQEPDRLALARVGDVEITGLVGNAEFVGLVRAFWTNSVFLRLSPNTLAKGSPAKRKSFEPLLDEEGQNLPALLNELSAEQMERLVDSIQQILPDIRAVEVSRPSGRRDENVYYHLKEQMPYKGRAGKSLFSIPAWMLSEGTRRITAILALLQHDPKPSLLCIEEIENGLDPWTTTKVVEHLQEATSQGTQVIITTHSPWLLDHVPLETILHVERKQGETRYRRFSDVEAVKAYQGRVPGGAIYAQSLGPNSSTE